MISKKIGNILPDYKKSVNRVFQALLHGGGLLLTEEAMKVGASVHSKKLFKSNETNDELISSLIGLNIIDQPRKDQYPEYLTLSSSFRNKGIDVNKQLFSRLRDQYVNRLFIDWFINWLRHQNMVAWESNIGRQSPFHAVFNDQLWDAVSFTYLYGYYRKHEDKKIPSPVFIEAQINRMMYEEDIEGFVTRFKMQDARYKVKTYGERIMPVILYNQMSAAAFARMKQEGLMSFQLKNILGPKIEELIQFLKNPWTLKNTNEAAEDWMTWMEENKLVEFMPLIHDELKFIKAAVLFKEKKYTLKQHIIIKQEGIFFEVEWSLLNEEKNHLIIFTSENLRQLPLNKEKEEVISNHFFSHIGLKPEFYKVM
ncbi:hypothetical protein [Planomicrobium okeanokoites]|uniref:hypothetical protein n=1 Tax=Planomicrobium okeanokoites TaxID=244 RepID=UPI002491ABCF|nr:hypothetical protein [Planomicrobium okeanokoites]